MRGGANTAKQLATDASWESVDAARRTFEGYGLSAEYDVEREFRRTPRHRVAPISTDLVLSCLAEHGLPRSF